LDSYSQVNLQQESLFYLQNSLFNTKRVILVDTRKIFFMQEFNLF
jgi:hypothetical protein